MNAFTEPLLAMTEYQEIRTRLSQKAGTGILEITGCIAPQERHLLLEFLFFSCKGSFILSVRYSWE